MRNLCLIRSALIRVALAISCASLALPVRAQVTFSTPTNISWSIENARLPSLVVEQVGPDAGRPWVFWYDFTSTPNAIWCSQRDAGTWDLGARCEPNMTAAWAPQAAVDGLGRVHLAWRDETVGREDIYYSVLTAGVWSSPFNVSNTMGDSRRVSLAIDPTDDTPHVVWLDGTSGALRFWAAHHDGVDWQPGAETGLPYEQEKNLDNLRLVADSTGTLHVVWFDGTGSFKEIFHAERPRAGSWSAAENISLTAAERSDEPSIAVGPDDTLHVVWAEQEDMVGDAWEVWYATRPPLGSWGTPVAVSLPDAGIFKPVVAVASDGVARIAWSSTTNGEVAYIDAPGETAINVSRSVTDASSGVSIAIAPDDTVHLAWQERIGTQEIYHAMTEVPPIDLRVDADGMDVLLGWTGGAAPFGAFRATAPDPGATWTEITPPGGITESTWTDAGVRFDGIDYYYLVESLP